MSPAIHYRPRTSVFRESAWASRSSSAPERHTRYVFKILFVCSGNRCRSPYAHVVTERLVPDWVRVSSAGTLDIVSAAPPTELIKIAGSRGVDLAFFKSRPLAHADPQEADLVLGMALEHVSSSVVDAGADPEKSFQLSEFVSLLEALDSESAPTAQEARRLVARVHERRLEQTFAPSIRIEDPIGGPPSAYVAMAEKLDDLCRRLAGELFAI